MTEYILPHYRADTRKVKTGKKVFQSWLWVILVSQPVDVQVTVRMRKTTVIHQQPADVRSTNAESLKIYCDIQWQTFCFIQYFYVKYVCFYEKSCIYLVKYDKMTTVKSTVLIYFYCNIRKSSTVFITVKFC